MFKDILMTLIVIGIIVLAICATVADPIKKQTVMVCNQQIVVGVHTKREMVSVVLEGGIAGKDIFRKDGQIKTLTRVRSRWGTFASVAEATTEEAQLFCTVFPMIDGSP